MICIPTRARIKSQKIYLVLRITKHISIKIVVISCKINRVLGGPAAQGRVIIADAEANKISVAVMEAARKAKGNIHSWISIRNYTAEGIVVNSFYDVSGGIYNGTQGADLVVGEIIGAPIIDHGNRHSAIGVGKTHNQVVVRIVNGQ